VSVLVALIGETRAWQLTAPSFFSQLLDPLQADLALCVRDGEETNPFYHRALHVWTFEESGDWNAEYDRVAAGPGWRCLLEVDPMFMGPIKSEEHPQKASAAILYFYRRLLRQSIEAEGLIDRYDWIIVSRSDLLWTLPHPPVERLSARNIHFLDGEQYGGVTDRHAIVPRRHAATYLRLTEEVFDDPVGLKRRIDRFLKEDSWRHFNIERFLAWRLWELGLSEQVRYVPYVAYAVRPPRVGTRWTEGVFDERLGYYVKYPSEKERCEISARFITDPASWRRYLAPIRGLRRRRALLEAYRDRGLLERRFAEEPDLLPLTRRARTELRRLPARLGRRLRRVPRLAPLLDARAERLRLRAERRGSAAVAVSDPGADGLGEEVERPAGRP
jgi:hypothetical protein